MNDATRILPGVFPLFLLLFALVIAMAPGCASRGRVRHYPVPEMTERQVMGFEKPAGMVQDPASGQWALREVMEAYSRLKEKARREGFELVLISARRSFADQKYIWNRKWRESVKKGGTDENRIAGTILRFTHVPGYSRHHWGTDLDLSEEMARRNMRDPIGSKTGRSDEFYRWLTANAPLYGFCRPYRGSGIVKDEPWHWTYIRLANFYEEQMERVVSFNRIGGRGILGEGFLRNNLKHVIRQQRRSVDVQCRSIYEETEGVAHVQKRHPQLTGESQKRIINPPFFLTFPTPSQP